ncbi:hypothetical protein BLA29_015516 [Euroglyphus maynei]|uniref:Uncharacterized protein n=1 Tax=Euroglyphus maynei TaxID=6958 RepID=A0A1Y3AWY7_EURMA|nr:hypothetical protein BLA29_015516 [Euroglyphus maynei]
MCPGHRKGR